MMETIQFARASRMGLVIRALSFVGCTVAAASLSHAAEPDATATAYFEKHIRPILVSKCYACHSASLQAKGGLRLDTREGVRVGGQTGAALIPGKPEDSLLIEAIKYEGLKMPPKEKLSNEVIAHFEEWIRLGAPDPREEIKTPIAGERAIDFEQERKHWSFQTPQKPGVPTVRDAQWGHTEIDRFVLARLEAVALKPAADTDRATWLRRVTFDLTGLPATPGEILDFELDQSAQAKEKVVDRLLATAQFGERWGRHWLDVVRFGESTGKERNFVYLQAWRFRNYVIDAFNQDKPYDQFLREQIAGDLLPHANDQERDTHHIATGFLALNPKGINDRNRESFLLEIVDEQIESIGRGVMGISIGCARCHDHKYDPIPTTDYYAVAGIFRSTEARFGMLNRQRYINDAELLIPLAAAENRLGQAVPTELIAKAKAGEEQFRKMQQELRRLRNSVAKAAVPAVAAASPAAPAEAAAGSPAVPATTSTVAAPGTQGEESATAAAASSPETAKAEVTPEFLEEKEKAFREFVQEQDKLRKELGAASANTTLIGVVDRSDPADIPVRVRGEVDKPGPVVPRGFLTVLKTEATPKIRGQQSGRAELASWLTSRENPLVARVYVNRVWSKLLGAGIVATVDDFGVQGQSPSHPELLDYLTVTFTEQGWSTKKLIREIVLSRVYAVGQLADPKNQEIDSENKLLWRWNRRRLEAEAIRDSVLAVSGQIDLRRPSGTPLVELGTRELGAGADFTPVQRPSLVRSVYLPQLRGQIPEMLALFDMADPSLTVGTRAATSGPDQALYLLNSPELLQQSRSFAERLLASPAVDDAARIDLAFRLAIGRTPTAVQRDEALQFLKDADQAATDTKAAEPTVNPRLIAWSRFSQLLFALPDFRYVF